MSYDIVLYFASGSSLKYNDAREYSVANGVLSFTDKDGLAYVTNMPFVVAKRKARV